MGESETSTPWPPAVDSPPVRGMGESREADEIQVTTGPAKAGLAVRESRSASPAFAHAAAREVPDLQRGMQGAQTRGASVTLTSSREMLSGATATAARAGWGVGRRKGRPRTNSRVTGQSWSTQSKPIVFVLQPGYEHSVMIDIGISVYPAVANSKRLPPCLEFETTAKAYTTEGFARRAPSRRFRISRRLPPERISVR